MNKFLVKNLSDGKYYTYGPNGIEFDNTLPEPPKEEFHLSIVKMDLAEFCLQKDAFQETSDCVIIFTDIFYTGFYSRREFFTSATYICENPIDFYYFSRYLKVKLVLSKIPSIIDDVNTILINPTHYDTSIFKNVIYTTILTPVPYDGMCNAVCNNDEKTIFIENHEQNLQLLPLKDFSVMLPNVVYHPRQDLTQDDTFRIIFGYLMKYGSIHITNDTYNFVSNNISKMKLFYPVVEKFMITPKIGSQYTTTTTNGTVLFIQ